MTGTVRGQTTLITYAFFHVGARAALTTAEQTEEGQSYHLLNALVLTSFLAEAYFNDLGEKIGYPDWNSGIDKKTSIWSKYKLLREKLGLPASTIDEAYPGVRHAIDFRNSMAHGRTETHRFSMTADTDVLLGSHKIPVGWQTSLCPKNVRACFDECRTMIYELHKAASLGNHPFSKMSSSQIRYSSD